MEDRGHNVVQLEGKKYNVGSGTATVEVKQGHKINVGKLLKIMDVEVGQKVKVTIEKVE